MKGFRYLREEGANNTSLSSSPYNYRHKMPERIAKMCSTVTVASL